MKDHQGECSFKKEGRKMFLQHLLNPFLLIWLNLSSIDGSRAASIGKVHIWLPLTVLRVNMIMKIRKVSDKSFMGVVVSLAVNVQ